MPKTKLVLLIALLSGISIILSSAIFAQPGQMLRNDFSYRIEKVISANPFFHAVFKPLSLSIEARNHLIDSIYNLDKTQRNDFIYINKTTRKLIVNPVLHSSFRVSTSFEQHYALGLQMAAEFGKKLRLDLNVTTHALSRNGFDNTRNDSAQTIYHLGQTIGFTSNYYFALPINGKITWLPNRFLSFQAGKDQLFWGDGYRSLFISDNSPSFPFFSTTLQFWKIKYTHVFAALKDYTVGKYDHVYNKYLSMHMISWNATKRLNISLFEAVVWAQNDTISGRSLDINYLNPFIFYRPLEYTLGSHDNVMVGMGFRYRFFQNTHVYGQFMLDEFYLKEIKAKREWWANKYALQMGVKTFDLFNIVNLYAQAEYNQARPFTFTHSRALENYGNMLQPLAHPNGANFKEIIGIMHYSKNRWVVSGYVNYLKYGKEPGGKTVGTDIYFSSNARAKDYGNIIGQGIALNQFIQELTLSRIIKPRWGLALEAGISNVNINSDKNTHQVLVTFGLKTKLYNYEKLF